MNQTRLWAAAAIILVVVIAGFALSVPHAREVPAAPPSPAEALSAPLVTLHDAFKKGTHTITGSLEAPDACTTASAAASLTGDASSTESILVAIQMPADSGVCLRLPTRAAFSATISAPSGLPLTATVNGVAASTSAP